MNRNMCSLKFRDWRRKNYMVTKHVKCIQLRECMQWPGSMVGSGCKSGGSPRHNVQVSGRKGGAFQGKSDKSCKIMPMSKNTLYQIPDCKVSYFYTKLRSLQDAINGVRRFERWCGMERQGHHDWWYLQWIPIRHKIHSFIHSTSHASIHPCMHPSIIHPCYQSLLYVYYIPDTVLGPQRNNGDQQSLSSRGYWHYQSSFHLVKY